MKKILHIIIFFILCIAIQEIQAKWYGLHSRPVDWEKTICPPDSQPDTIWPLWEWPKLDTDKQFWYLDQARAYGGSRSNNKYNTVVCQYWDSTPPQVYWISYHNGWTKERVPYIQVNASDYGGSGLSWYQFYLKYSDDRNEFKESTFSEWQYYDGGRLPDTEWRAYKFAVVAYDGAGNASQRFEGNQIYKLDTIKPKIQEIRPVASQFLNTTNSNNKNFMAWELSPIGIIYDSKSSPVRVEYSIEDDNNPQNRIEKISSAFVYKGTLNDKFQNVDNDRWADGWRKIDLKIKKIIDEAGNELDVPEGQGNYTFNVFANILQPKITNLTPSGKFIADGQENIYGQEITDIYNNKIVPAPNIGRTLQRDTKTIENTMYLNQKMRNNGSSVFVNDKSLPLISGEKIPTELNQIPKPNTGQYTFNLKVYTPTANAYQPTDSISDPLAKFSLESAITVRDRQDLIRSVAEKTFDPLKIENPVYKPLFTNAITGNLQDGWFIEWVNQESTITTTKNPQSPVTIWPETWAEYSWDNAEKFTLRLKNTLFEKGNYKELGDGGVQSFLKQKENTVSNASNIYMSTHFVYSLDRKNITYNGDVIAKAHYHDGETKNNAIQVGVKIIGNSAKNNFYRILEWQEDNIWNSILTLNIGNIRSEISKSIALATRNMVTNDAGKNLWDVARIPSGTGVKAWIVNHSNTTSVMFIEANNQTIELSAEKISGKRTIVVRGGNVHITKDMYYADDNSILGVVVQKNANGNGGNLYISPEITNIVGSYILDGSVMSYKNGREINVGNISELKNQLHIYGSILSQNTIGGSRKNPPSCPIFVITCNESTAQKYDLNYLRRYYLFNGKPFGGDSTKIIGGWNKNNLAPNNSLKKIYTNFSDDLAKYPVVIEYDKRLLTNPPVGLEKYRE